MITTLSIKNYALIEKLSINPRKILNLFIPKIEIGELANLTILDIDLVWTVDRTKFLSKSINTPFNKKLLAGKPLGVINKKKMFFEGFFTEI